MGKRIPQPSVSILSDVIRSNSNDLLVRSQEYECRQLSQSLLRVQVLLVVLGLTLLIVCTVAVIEERTLLGLGFGVCVALAAILSAIAVLTSCNIKVSSALNIISFVLILPTVGMIITSFYRYLDECLENKRGRLTNYNMIFVLSVVQLLHLIPITSALIYNLVLLHRLQRCKQELSEA